MVGIADGVDIELELGKRKCESGKIESGWALVVGGVAERCYDLNILGAPVLSQANKWNVQAVTK